MVESRGLQETAHTALLPGLRGREHGGSIHCCGAHLATRFLSPGQCGGLDPEHGVGAISGAAYVEIGGWEQWGLPHLQGPQQLLLGLSQVALNFQAPGGRQHHSMHGLAPRTPDAIDTPGLELCLCIRGWVCPAWLCWHSCVGLGGVGRGPQW